MTRLRRTSADQTNGATARLHRDADHAASLTRLVDDLKLGDPVSDAEE